MQEAISAILARHSVGVGGSGCGTRSAIPSRKVLRNMGSISNWAAKLGALRTQRHKNERAEPDMCHKRFEHKSFRQAARVGV